MALVFGRKHRKEEIEVSQLATVERYDLGELGIDWVRQALVAGRDLSQAVLAHLNLAAGSAHTYLPAGWLRVSRTNLEHGAFHDSELATMSSTAAIESFLTAPGLVVVESDVARPGDASVARRANETLRHGDTVLFWTRAAGTRPSDLEHFVSRGGSGYPTNAFLLAGHEAASFNPIEAVDDQELLDLAARVRAVLVNAFDAESYVVWLPRP